MGGNSMLKKRHGKLICSLLLLSLISTTSMTANAFTSKPTEKNPDNPALSLYESGQYKTTFDANIGDEERLIEMLKKEGKIPEDATDEEANTLLHEYLHNKAINSIKPLTEKEVTLGLKSRENQTAQSAGEVNEVNILTVLADYSDYTHNNIKPDETDMYYENYDCKHFYDILFGDEGYTSPAGRKCKSLKQYYLEQSNNSFIVNGEVIDWKQVDKPAAYYGGNAANGDDLDPQQLVQDVLDEAVKDGNLDLSKYDKIDRYDYDEDGNYNEPDGEIDYLMVIHAGVGEDAGGGALGADAIWSHRSNLLAKYEIPGTSFTDENGNARPYYAYDYTMCAESGASGVFCHEFGHNIGLPDEYDTIYSSDITEPVTYWSLMASGSWCGETSGCEPSSISPYGKEKLQNIYGGGWQRQTAVNYDELTRWGKNFKLTPASGKSDVVRVNLPSISKDVVKPYQGSNVYWGGSKELKNNSESMFTSVDLTNTTNPQLTFKTMYDIEDACDFASIQVKSENHPEWTCLEGNITVSQDDPNGSDKLPYAITGASDGWVDAAFDLSAYAGEKIQLKFKYTTDPALFLSGIFIDQITVSDGENMIFSDDAESGDKFTLNGFIKTDGIKECTQYYLIELRNHQGVDAGLSHINKYGTFSYDPGMLVWFVDNTYNNNWRARHLGHGMLSVIDADQKNVFLTNGKGKTPLGWDVFQLHDAAFSNKLGSKFNIPVGNGISIVDDYRHINRHFNDVADYSNSEIPELGTVLPKLGINIDILTQTIRSDRMTIRISRK